MGQTILVREDPKTIPYGLRCFTHSKQNLSPKQGLLFLCLPGKCTAFFPLLVVAEVVGTSRRYMYINPSFLHISQRLQRFSSKLTRSSQFWTQCLVGAFKLCVCLCASMQWENKLYKKAASPFWSLVVSCSVML